MASRTTSHAKKGPTALPRPFTLTRVSTRTEDAQRHDRYLAATDAIKEHYMSSLFCATTETADIELARRPTDPTDYRGCNDHRGCLVHCGCHDHGGCHDHYGHLQHETSRAKHDEIELSTAVYESHSGCHHRLGCHDHCCCNHHRGCNDHCGCYHHRGCRVHRGRHEHDEIKLTTAAYRSHGTSRATASTSKDTTKSSQPRRPTDPTAAATTAAATTTTAAATTAAADRRGVME
jgi:hypothetical protein